MKRREFVQKTASALFFPIIFLADKKKTKKILVLGGTNFVGPAIVNECLSKGYEVELFNRGQTNPGLFTKLKCYKGDRTSGMNSYASLKDGYWDAVIDVWPADPKLVREATDFFKSRTKQYVFVSSIGVYTNYGSAGITETDPIWDGEERPNDTNYGLNKALCEKAVRSAFPDNHLIVRPGAIVGERNPDHGFYFWTVRVAMQKEVLSPGTGNDFFQAVDVKDVAGWIENCISRQYSGIYNLVGPEKPTSFRIFLETCKRVTGSSAELIWVSESFLKSKGLPSWGVVPLWAPLSEDPGFTQINASKAIAKGWKVTPVEHTVSASLKWYKDHFPASHKFGMRNQSAGFAKEKEEEFLKEWVAFSRK